MVGQAKTHLYSIIFQMYLMEVKFYVCCQRTSLRVLLGLKSFHEKLLREFYDKDFVHTECCI